MASYDNTKNFYLDQEETISNSSATGKAQTIVVDDTMGPDTGEANHRVLSGDFNNASKAIVTGGRDVINASGQALHNATILGDAAHLTASTFTGGADKITLGSVTSGDAKIMGDANSINGGTARGGNDTIIVEGDMTAGGTIVGDAHTVINATFIAGNDNIQVKGNVTNGQIFTDISSDLGVNNVSGGNDSITLGVKGEEGQTTVIRSWIGLGFGNDVFTSYSSIDYETTIEGGLGDDKFILESIKNTSAENGAYISGGVGNDSFSVNELLAGDISGGEGNDVFNITHAGAGRASGGGGKDKFTITNANATSIDGGSDNDSIIISETAIASLLRGGADDDNIHVKNLNDNSVAYGDTGDDTIHITNMNYSVVYGDRSDILTIGSDKITVTNNIASDVYGGAGKDVIDVTNATSVNSADLNKIVHAKVDGGRDDDTIKVTNTTGATINGNDGDDTITVTNLQNLYDSQGISIQDGTIDAGAGDDSIVVTNAFGSIHGGLNDDIIRVTKTADAANIYGGDGQDNINVVTASNATKMYGGDGDDKITVTNLKGGSRVEGDADNDSITVTTTADSSILGDAGNDSINVISTATATNIDAGADDDSVTVTTLKASSTLYGGLGDDSIKVINLTDSQIYGYQSTEPESDDAGADSISITTMTDSILRAGAGDNEVKIATIKGDNNTLDMGAGNDYLSITTNSKSNLGDDDFAIALGAGNDTLQVNWAFNGNFASSESAGVYDGDTLITKGLGVDASFEFGSGNDGLRINGTLNRNIFSSSAENMGDGHDSLFVATKTAAMSDTSLVEALGTEGQDTLHINWAFNGIFEAGDDGATLITKGLSATSSLHFDAGDDGFVSTAAISGTAINPRYITTHAGNDTIELVSSNYVNINTSGGDGSMSDDDHVTLTKTAANGSINLGIGDDSLSIASTATNMQITVGEGSDTVSLGGMSNSKLRYDAKGSDAMSIKGTFNAGMVESVITNPNEVDPDAPTLSRVAFDGLATDNDGGFITIDTWGSGQFSFGAGDDTLTINKAINASLAAPRTLELQEGDDVVELYSANYTYVDLAEGNNVFTIKSTFNNSVINAENGDDVLTLTSATNSFILLGKGDDKASISSLGTGSTLYYTVDGVDSISLGGTYNAHTVVSDFTDPMTNAYKEFLGLATGDDGGSITLDTLGTGKLYFGAGADSLTITKTLSGSTGLKDIFMQDGADSVILHSVNGAIISGGGDADSISATSLGATGVLNGDAGADTIQIGRVFGDSMDFKATTTMSNGTIHGGSDGDTIFIGNTLDADDDGFIEAIKGTLSGGKVYGGEGNDTIATATLSGSALMDGGSGSDVLNSINMSGGTMNGGDGDDIHTVENIFSRGTINGDAGEDVLGAFTMSGGTINAGWGNDIISIKNLKGGVINSDDGADTIEIIGMTGGTINSSFEDAINITHMNGGIINDSDDTVGSITVETMIKGSINAYGGKDTIEVVNMKGGTVNGGTGADAMTITTMDGGAVNGQDGDDSLFISNLNGGTVNLGEGNNQLRISSYFNGGTIVGGKGNDTLILNDSINLGTGYSINLGAGENKIQVESALYGKNLNLGASHDNVSIENLKTRITSSKINLGAGNDTFTSTYLEEASSNVINSGAIGATLLDAGTGNDVIDITTTNEDTIIYAGVGNDTVTISSAEYTIIDLGTGSNELTVDTASNNTIITGNTGNDSITVSTLSGGSALFASTGNDTIDVTIAIDDKGTSELEDDVISGTIYYDNKGQDNIVLNEYREGMVSDAKGNTTDANDAYFALSTGTDGGSIELNTWTNGEISFGNGHDNFVLNNDLSNKGEVAFFQGNDSIKVTGSIDANSSISYDNRGQDSIDLTTYTGAEISNTFGSDSALSTGTDGGSITLGSWAGGSINFGKGNDNFALNSGTVFESIDLATGKDSIDVAALSSDANKNILYNNDGFDSIVIGDTYDGIGIEAQDGKLSTGAGGGFISVQDITGAGIENVVFNTGNVNESFSIETLRAHDNEGIIDLGQGVDTIHVGQMGTEGTATITYNNVGFDSIHITDSYNGVGIEDQNGKLSTGADGGHIHIGSLVSAAGVANLEFSAKNDSFSTGSFNVDDADASIDLGLGNDTLKVLSLGVASAEPDVDPFIMTIDLGDGNNTVLDATIAENGVLLGGSGVDNITATIVAGKIDAGAGNNKFNIEGITGIVTAGSGADIFDVTRVNGRIDAGDGNNKITADALNNATITSGSGNDTLILGTHDTEIANNTINLGDGNNSLTLHGSFLNGSISGGKHADVINAATMSADTLKTFAGNDVIHIETFIHNFERTTIIEAGEGNDKITIDAILPIQGGATDERHIYGDNADGSGKGGNDNFTINYIGGATLHGGAGNDVFDIGAIHGGTIMAGDADDRIDITEMHVDSIVDGGTGSNTYTIDSMFGGTVRGDSTAGTDSIKIITMNGGTVDAKFGADSINITHFNGGTINGGLSTDQIFTDSFTITNMQEGAILDGGTGHNTIKVINMDGGLINGIDGNDTITITTATGGTINGGLAFTNKVDSITIGNASNMSIYGDSGSPSSDEQLSNDVIKITGTAENTFISGDSGNDTITVSIAKGSSIVGGIGNDSITVTTGIGNEVDGGLSIGGGEGDDTIGVTTLNRGSIEGGTATLDASDPDNVKYGRDSISVKNAYDSNIYGDKFIYDTDSDSGGLLEPDKDLSYNDLIKVSGVATDSNIYAGYGQDTITVTTMNGSSILVEEDDAIGDSVTVINLNNSTIVGGAGGDTISVTNSNGSFFDSLINGGAGNDSIKITTLTSNSQIMGGAGDDTIDITTVKLGITGLHDINGGEGKDSIIIKTMTSGYISGGDGSDTIEITTANNIFIDSREGADIEVYNEFISIGTATDSKIFTGVGDDSIKITNSVRSEVRAGAGDDTITVGIKGMSNSTITGGDGADDFIITGTKNSSITIEDFSYDADENLGDSILVNGKDVTEDAKAAQDALQNAFTTKDGVTIYLGNVEGTDENDVISITNLITPNANFGTINNIADAFDATINGNPFDVNNLTRVEGLLGADTITIGNAEYASVYGESLIGTNNDDGNNDITLTNSKYSIIFGGNNDDSITINNAIGSLVVTGDGSDTVTITKQLASSLVVTQQGTELDTLYLTGNMGSKTHVTLGADQAGFIVAKGYNEELDMYESLMANGGTLHGSEGADTFHLGTISAATINGGDSDDAFNVLTMNSGNLNGNAGYDLFTITALNGGKVDGGEGVDTVNINLGINKTVNIANSGVEQDTIGLSGGITSAGTVNLISESGFYMTSEQGNVGFFMNAGTLHGSNGADNFFVREIKGGTINGGEGADTILITSALGGTVDGGIGADTVTISNELVKSLSVKNSGFEADTLFLAGDLAIGAKLSLTSNAGFVVAKAYNVDDDVYNVFHMAGGSLTGSAGNDTMYAGNLSNNAVLNGGAGNDFINLFYADGATIDGGTGVDTINFRGDTIPKLSITNTSNTQDEIWLDFGFTSGELSLSGTGGSTLATSTGDSFNMEGGTIVGSSGSESIFIKSMTGGSINAGNGNDYIEFFSYQGGSIDSGTGVDNIGFIHEIKTELTITNSGKEQDILQFYSGVEDGADITLAGIGGFNVTAHEDGFIMYGGTLTASAVADKVIINEMTDGTINGGAGNDNFTIANLEAGTVNGDAGNDVFTISSAQTGTINGGDGKDTINASIAGNVNVSMSGGAGADRFNITGTDSSSAYIVDLEKGDSLFINNKNVTTNALKAQDAGEVFFSHDGVTIFFKQDLSIITRTITSTVDRENNESSRAPLNLLGGIAEGGELNLTGTGGFYVSNAGAPFTMSGGTINASNAADSFNLTMTGGIINGSAGNEYFNVHFHGGSINGQDGNDTFIVNITAESSGVLIGGAGADKFYIASKENSYINILEFDATHESDTLSINNTDVTADFQAALDNGDVSFTHDGVTINVGNAIIDTLTTTVDFENNESSRASLNLLGGVAEGGELNLTGTGGFYVSNAGAPFTMSGGTINASNAIDIFKLIMTGGTINGGDDTDYFTASMTGGTINGGAGVDYFTVSMHGGTLNGGNGSDNFELSNIVSGTINTGAVGDRISITDAFSGSLNVYNESSRDTVVIEGSIEQGAQLNLSGESGFDLQGQSDRATMNGGSINGSAQDDTFSVTINGGIINAGAGNDTFFTAVAGENSGILIGGAGADRYYISSEENSSINILGFDATHESDTLSINSTDVSANAQAALDNGDASFTHDGVTIHFAKAQTYADPIITGQYANHNADYSQFMFIDAGIDGEGFINASGTGDYVFTNSTGTGFDMTEGVINRIEGGNNTFIVNSMASNTALTSGEGDDVFRVNDMQGGEIDSGAGNDTIITNIDASTTNAIIELGYKTGADRIEINSKEASEITITNFDDTTGDTLFLNGEDVTTAASAFQTGGTLTYNDFTIYFDVFMGGNA